jgi:Cu/Zn superoxide dismutase
MNVMFDAYSYSIWGLLACLLVFQLIESSSVYLNGEPEIFKARAVIRGMAGSRSINGALNFEQFSVDGPVIISGTIRGLRPGLHGLHIHQNGNLSDSCKAAGPHFNPFNVSTRRINHLNALRDVLSPI